MKIRILVNQLGDADSIFIGVLDEKRSLVILLDGGRKGDAGKLKGKLDSFLAFFGKKAPDLVIASHYDDDHIAGIQPLITPFGKDVHLLWAFDTENLHASLQVPEEKESILPSDDDTTAGAAFQSNGKEIDVLIESIKKEQDLLRYAKATEIETVQPVVNECSLAEWPEVVILSPTRAYYDSLFPKNLKPASLLVEQAEAKADSGRGSEAPCECLSLKKSPISAVNLNSCIFKITVEGKVFLFAADAGIDSFYQIENYQEQLKDIFWLKVPHHGSANNLNKELIELMSPKIAVISGDKHVSGEIVRCLQKGGAEVIVTSAGDFDRDF
ncbi:MAG: hypothetical protein J0I41_19760 [Filimonas sp.]|nr:hypothetical protein [Filimonas sp.]